MAVGGLDGDHVGTVYHLEGQRLKSTRTDPSAGGKHHFTHVDAIAAIENGEVGLNRTADEAKDERAGLDADRHTESSPDLAE